MELRYKDKHFEEPDEVHQIASEGCLCCLAVEVSCDSITTILQQYYNNITTMMQQYYNNITTLGSRDLHAVMYTRLYSTQLC